MVEFISSWKGADECGEILADLVVNALIDEVELTPKPGLVDRHSSGAHTDLDIDMMRRSAQVLRDTFAEMARTAFGQQPSQTLREQLAEIGRNGERVMFAATGGTNTHRGAIWALGLLTAGAAISGPHASFERIAAVASEIARYSDRFAPTQESNGSRAEKQYGVSGARGEAQRGFPHVIHIALPKLKAARDRGVPELFARLDALIAIMSSLDDTCLLHRGGMEALHVAKQGAKKILSLGGTSTPEGWNALHQLDADLLARNASPGGSADLLAATLFLDRLYSYSLKSIIWLGNGEGFGNGDHYLSIQSRTECK